MSFDRTRATDDSTPEHAQRIRVRRESPDDLIEIRDEAMLGDRPARTRSMLFLTTNEAAWLHETLGELLGKRGV